VAESSADPGATASLSYFIPVMRVGRQALPGGGGGLTPLINGEFEPAPTTTPVPETVAPVLPPPTAISPFRLLPARACCRGVPGRGSASRRRAPACCAPSRRCSPPRGSAPPPRRPVRARSARAGRRASAASRAS
jgi:hypothetical protein